MLESNLQTLNFQFRKNLCELRPSCSVQTCNWSQASDSEYILHLQQKTLSGVVYLVCAVQFPENATAPMCFTAGKNGASNSASKISHVLSYALKFCNRVGLGCRLAFKVYKIWYISFQGFWRMLSPGVCPAVLHQLIQPYSTLHLRPREGEVSRISTQTALYQIM